MYYNEKITAKEYQKMVDELLEEKNNPETPQGKIDGINIKLSNARNNLRIALEREYESNNDVSVYGSDDYIGCSAGDYSFYFGYEETKCPIHKTEDDCYENDCDKREWVFQVEKNNKVVFEMLDSEISYPKTDNIERKLIVGMAHFINQVLKDTNK